MLAYIGAPVDPALFTPASQWGCFAALPPPATPPPSRPPYASGNELRFIAEPPVTFSDLTLAAPDWDAACRYPVPFAAPAVEPRDANLTSNECEDRMDACDMCYQRRITRVCAPMEPLYGAAVLPVPGASAFLIFGGRGALEQINDLPACSQLIPENAAWRFQYHAELEPQALASRNGTERALPGCCAVFTLYHGFALQASNTCQADTMVRLRIEHRF